MKLYLLTSTLLLISILSKAQWTPGGIQLAPDSANNYSPQIAMNSSNSSWVVWRGEDTVYFNGSIYLTGYDRHGDPLYGFSSGAVAICENGDYYMPQVLMSDDSDVVVSWYGYADSTSSFSRIYIQKFNQSGSALWNGGNAIIVSANDSSQDKFPLLASDKSDGVYVCWTRFDFNLDPSSTDIMLERFDQNGNIASGWSVSPDPVAAASDTADWYPKIAVTPSGDAVYVQYLSGLIGDLSLWLKRVSASNGVIARGFSHGSGIELSVGPNLIPVPEVESFVFCDTAGNALSVWDEYRISANGEIYYQKTLADSARILQANGKRIAGNANNGYGYLYASMDDDGAILATWNDYAVNYDVGGAKFKSDGTIVWVHATPITSNNNSAYPKILPDHFGGSYIFYMDVTNSPDVFYCLHLDGAGNLSWTPPGLMIGLNYNVDGFDPQLDFQVANVNAEQSNEVWEFTRGSFYNVFSCNVLPSRQSCFDAPNAVPSFSSPDDIIIYPNPSKDKFTVSVSLKESGVLWTGSGLSSSLLYFELYNEMGMLVEKRTFKESVIMYTSGLAEGIYFGRVFNEQGNAAVGKVVIGK